MDGAEGCDSAMDAAVIMRRYVWSDADEGASERFPGIDVSVQAIPGLIMKYSRAAAATR